MNWFFIALIAPLLWSIVNHIDKYLLSKSHDSFSVNVLMLYSTGFSIFVIPTILLFSKDQMFYSLAQVTTQIVGGILLTFSIYFYLLALKKEEASKVIPLSMLVPVFGYFLSFFFLHEILSTKQIIACLIIILGSLILSLEITEEKRGFKIKHQVLLLMAFCALFQAIQETLFKHVTLENSFIVSIFWIHVGILIYGIVLVLFNRKLLKEFLISTRKNGRLMFGFSFLSELVNAIAYMVRDYSMLLAPIAIIMTLNGYQPVFVFVLGTFLTIFFPRFAKEKIKPIHLVHKFISIGIIILGTTLITQTL
jgi:uncharacterized membrane protein